MEDTPLSILFGMLALLLACSAFFSGSETALMSLNRYRLNTLAKQGHKGAKLAQKLLAQPDRLIGLILLGNNFINILITQLATYIGYRVFGDAGIAITTGILTLILLIFAEVAPKTLGALHAEKFAFPASYVYTPLLKLSYPLVWLINFFANSLLKMLGVPTEHISSHALSSEEIRTVVHEAGDKLDSSHQDMLLGILDLEKERVEDVMIPRSEVVGIDLDDDWNDIEELIKQTTYTRMPVYRGTLDNVIGYIHLRSITSLLVDGELTRESLEANLREPYFIPESTSLTQQLLNFKRTKRRHALVVDEYGDILGIITLEDLLEEIVGEFTHDPTDMGDDIHPQEDGSFIVDASLHIREINRQLDFKLPTDGPKTLNGLILEHLETIPTAGTSCLIHGYPIEVVKIQNNAVKTARIAPRLPQHEEPEAEQP